MARTARRDDAADVMYGLDNASTASSLDSFWSAPSNRSIIDPDDWTPNQSTLQLDLSAFDLPNPAAISQQLEKVVEPHEQIPLNKNQRMGATSKDDAPSTADPASKPKRRQPATGPKSPEHSSTPGDKSSHRRRSLTPTPAPKPPKPTRRDPSPSRTPVAKPSKRNRTPKVGTPAVTSSIAQSGNVDLVKVGAKVDVPKTDAVAKQVAEVIVPQVQKLGLASKDDVPPTDLLPKLSRNRPKAGSSLARSPTPSLNSPSPSRSPDAHNLAMIPSTVVPFKGKDSDKKGASAPHGEYTPAHKLGRFSDQLGLTVDPALSISFASGLIPEPYTPRGMALVLHSSANASVGHFVNPVSGTMDAVWKPASDAVDDRRFSPKPPAQKSLEM
ncbi:hypothetical protein BKA62DRAFT_720955 [Auriculariales sp. MPI-PUGE-AT-0066]|nr:hypothetical protein BKA62DRAFT_720955 [Auriculariales sp. MPI-PUGE-AT-0066]